MSMIKTPVNGMRDILPDEMKIRQELIKKMRTVYNSFGFEEIDTPMIEHIENLLSEQGWENEKLIFKILKRGEKLTKALDKCEEKELVDCGLRYDLTLPLCRFYSNNKDKLPSPFKAMQLSNVFRADRPQKGRFRQFMQCDIDILGDKSNLAEIDLLLATTTYLNSIGFDKYEFYYEINDRRILKSIQKVCGFDEEDFDKICIILDKMDKIGKDKLIEELKNNNISPDKISKYIDIIDEIQNDFDIDKLKSLLGNSIDDIVLDNLYEIINIVSSVSKVKIVFNPNLVRGMGYYTGTIYEIKANGFNGSVGGGGRYDEMVSKFISESVAAVGISIGFERIMTILMDDEYHIDNNNKKIAFCIDKNIDTDNKLKMFHEAYEKRLNGEIVNIVPAAKNKRFQRENLENNGYKEFLDF